MLLAATVWHSPVLQQVAAVKDQPCPTTPEKDQSCPTHNSWEGWARQVFDGNRPKEGPAQSHSHMTRCQQNWEMKGATRRQDKQLDM